MEFSSCNNSLTFNSTSSFNQIKPSDISGCVAYFNFDTSGTTFYDSVYGYSGTNVSGTNDYGVGRMGSCVIYNGSTSYLNISQVGSKVASNSGSFAISVWINYNGPSLGKSGANACIIGGRYGDNMVFVLSGNKSLIHRQDDTIRNSTGRIMGSGWEHLVLNSSRNAGSPTYLIADFFYNGSLIGIGSTLRTNNVTTQNVLFIGYETRSSFSFNGKIDELAIYNKNLSNIEVQQLYNFGYAKFNNLNGQNNQFSVSGQPNDYTFQTNNKLTMEV